jgi:hypothetical protein
MPDPSTAVRRGGLFLAILAIAALVGGVAYATNGSSGETIVGCAQRPEGQLRIVASEVACRNNETVVSWTSEGTNGYRFIWSAPPSSDIEVTAIGTGPVGFPAEGETETSIFAFTLPAGTYSVTATVGVRKDSGDSELLCYIRRPDDVVSAFMRTGVGWSSGYTHITTMHSDGVMPDGGQATLVCIQDGTWLTPTGDNPKVFYGTVSATKLASVTSTRIP